ncbi:MAG: cation transporter [Gammaproteobacteria bacterium]|nr:cation transporter [Gammaproteobacteria bacterium]
MAKQAHHYFWLSTAAALATITLKMLAWRLTGSISLASDAMESLVNLAAALFALWMILVAKVPPDDDHPLGHSKAEYFSSGFEGVLILLAACAILWAAVGRLLAPAPLTALDLGLALSVVSSGINLMVALIMRRAAVRYRSIAIEAGSKHLLTDVWTSAGVIVGVALVQFTGWLWLDPAVAILVACHILRDGVNLVRASVLGLMDAALSPTDLQVVQAVLDRLGSDEVSFANLRTRRAGYRNFVYVDVLVPGDWSVRRTHVLLDRIEAEITAGLPDTIVMTHAEPAPGTWQ